MGLGLLYGKSVLGVPLSVRCFLVGRGLGEERRRRLGLLLLLLLGLLIRKGLVV